MENPKPNPKKFFFSISGTRLAESTEGFNNSLALAAGKAWLCKLFKYLQQKLDPGDWKGWTTSKNPAIFRCNTANSSKNKDFRILQDFSLQHNLYSVAICNERMSVRKWSGLRCNLTTEIRVGLFPGLVATSCNRSSVLISIFKLSIEIQGRRNSGRAGEEMSELGPMETCKKQTNRYQLAYDCFCTATTLASKIIAELIENHYEFCGCANRCNKFVSSRSLLTIELPMIILWKSIPPFEN